VASEFLFAYGTLMHGFSRHHLLRGAAELVGTGTVDAQLLDLGAYPAAIPDPRATVRGEVYRVLHAGVWTILDSAEGPQYDRRDVAVRLGARNLTASIYWYRGPLGHGVPIVGGDYRAHVPVQSIHRG